MSLKFLIIQTAFIGDVVLATGIIEKLHDFYPDAKIDFLVRKGNESLFADHPYLNEILIWNKQTSKQKNLWKILQQVRNRKYDTVINVQRFVATGLLTVFSGAGQKIGFDKNPLSFLFTKRVRHVISTSEKPRHEIERNNDLIELITDAVAYKPRLYPSEKDFLMVEKFQRRPYICIAPASVWFTKQFPTVKWIEFCKVIPSTYQIYLLGASSDKILCNEIIESCPGIAISNLCGQLSFLQSAALMQGAVMNYVNDSAPMHFASAVNAAVTAVYCSTIPAFGFGPLSDKSFIIEIEEPLPCRPCGLHGLKACPLAHFNCAYKIKYQQLLHSIT